MDAHQEHSAPPTVTAVAMGVRAYGQHMSEHARYPHPPHMQAAVMGPDPLWRPHSTCLAGQVQVQAQPAYGHGASEVHCLDNLHRGMHHDAACLEVAVMGTCCQI